MKSRKLWIRVDADTPRDPNIVSLALSLGTSPGQMLGHCVCVWLAVAEHCADGDMSLVTPGTIEHWAQWTGPQGFGAAFLSTFVQDGVLQAFRDRNAKLAQKREKEREKKRRQRGGHRGDTKGTRELSPPTERNGTERNQLQDLLPGDEKSPGRERRARSDRKPKPDAPPPAPLATGWDRATWVAELTEYLRVRRGVLFSHGEVGRTFREAVKHYPRPQLEKALEFYDAHRTARQRPFLLRDVATDLPAIIALTDQAIAPGTKAHAYAIEGRPL